MYCNVKSFESGVKRTVEMSSREMGVQQILHITGSDVGPSVSWSQVESAIPYAFSSCMVSGDYFLSSIFIDFHLICPILSV
jgi:hypothetical protein